MAYKWKMRCQKGIVLSCFLLVFQAVYAQYDFGKLDIALNNYSKQVGNKLVALVYKNGSVIYKKEIGTEFTQRSQVPIASCSKWLTAAMVMTLVDEGKLQLDDKVSDYLPIFAEYGKKYITIRHCLSHQTGIEVPDGVFKGILERRKYASLEEMVDAYANKHEIENNPGQIFHYSSAGLDIAARVCEVIAKKPFERLIAERILRPCNMKETNFESNGSVNPSGGANSTANDYLNFLVMILNKGVFNGKRVLSENAIAEMQKNQVPEGIKMIAPEVGKGFSYGLGEWILEKNSKGESVAVSSPGLFGTWPLVDNCRGYACIILVKTLLNNNRKAIYTNLKQLIDEQLQANCLP